MESQPSQLFQSCEYIKSALYSRGFKANPGLELANAFSVIDYFMPRRWGFVVLVPKGVAHAYRNIGSVTGIVINCPNRLYMGKERSAEIDEIRHEDDPDTIFRMDD